MASFRNHVKIRAIEIFEIGVNWCSGRCTCKEIIYQSVAADRGRVINCGDRGDY